MSCPACLYYYSFYRGLSQYLDFFFFFSETPISWSHILFSVTIQSLKSLPMTHVHYYNYVIFILFLLHILHYVGDTNPNIQFYNFVVFDTAWVCSFQLFYWRGSTEILSYHFYFLLHDKLKTCAHYRVIIHNIILSGHLILNFLFIAGSYFAMQVNKTAALRHGSHFTQIKNIKEYI